MPATGALLSRPFLPLLLLLFVASGCAALIYEIVWLQLLQLSIGSSAVSLGVLLGTFMGGMCLGSLALPRLVPAGRHPLRVYALIELGIGICGVVILQGMPYLDRVYAAIARPGAAGILLRGAVCGAFLLPPAMLMGATLPAMARWVETTPRGVAWLGYFYGGNIAGAVAGCVLAGFYLLRVHDVAVATYAAAALNGAAAVVAVCLAALRPHAERGGDRTPDLAEPGPQAWPVYLAIALSGLCALGAEVVWTRLLSLMLGPTVYTFSIILAVFLAGLGIGSSGGAYLSRLVERPRLALGVCQLLLGAALAWTACVLAWLLPYWRIMPSLADPWLRFQIDMVHCLCAILPATLLWGASFPLALGAVARRGQDPGRLAGRVYAANTAGAITGALAFAMLVIPGLGTQHSQRMLMGLSMAAAVLAFGPLRRGKPGLVLLPASLMVVAVLVWKTPAVPWGVMAYGRQLPTRTLQGELLYLGEGMNASVVVSDLYKTLRFHVSGKVEASTDQQDMRVQRMLGHIPALLHPNPRSVLVVGCGAGVTAGSFVTHPEVERIVICEIEPLIPPAAERYFGRENHDVMRNLRTEVVHDDARHYILTTRDTFDIITSDPIHPWVKGSATLYTREYFELCKRHLKPGGFITQWVPLYESSLETVKSELATFFEVFPNGMIWGNDTAFEEGYDVVLMGQAGTSRIDVDELQRRLNRPDHAEVVKSLQELGFSATIHLLGTYAGRARDLRPWLRGAQINRDRNLRLQYLAGIGSRSQGAVFIYDEMLRYRVFPEDLFVSSSPAGATLRRMLRRP